MLHYSPCSHQGQRLGRVYLQLRSPGERELKKAGQTLPGKEPASRYSNSVSGTCHALLPSEFSFTLSCKHENVRQERQAPRSLKEHFREEEGDRQQCHCLGTPATDVFVPSKKNLVTHTHMPQVSSYPALSSIHRLFLKAFPDFEVDLSGADSGGSFDVELVPVLADLHVRFGGGSHRHLPEHGIDTWAKRGRSRA